MERPTHVLGFAFDAERRHILLIEKKRPQSIAGRMNGIGGNIEGSDGGLPSLPNELAEHGELPVEAMVREFWEETGIRSKASDWSSFASIKIIEPDIRILCFRSFGLPIDGARTTTDERVYLHRVELLPVNTLPSCRALVALALSGGLAVAELTFVNGD